MEPQSFGDGMANMTKHDTMQGAFHEPRRERAGRTRGAVPVSEEEAAGRSRMAGAFTHDKSESDRPARRPRAIFRRQRSGATRAVTLVRNPG